jgi:hypothetical protein
MPRNFLKRRTGKNTTDQPQQRITSAIKLENRQGCKLFVGSNPTPSAIFPFLSDFLGPSCLAFMPG